PRALHERDLLRGGGRHRVDQVPARTGVDLLDGDGKAVWCPPRLDAGCRCPELPELFQGRGIGVLEAGRSGVGLRVGGHAGSPVGHGRIYALRRQPLRELSTWLEAFESDHPSEAVLEQYRQAIEAERLLTERDAAESAERTFRLRRTLCASPGSVWARWTSAE